jgi:hypothetical protein
MALASVVEMANDCFDVSVNDVELPERKHKLHGVLPVWAARATAPAEPLRIGEECDHTAGGVWHTAMIRRPLPEATRPPFHEGTASLQVAKGRAEDE